MTLTSLPSELALAARRLRSARTFTIVATMTVALGTGALGAVTAVARSVFVEPLPFPQPDQIVVLGGEMRRDDVRSWPLGVLDITDVASMRPGMLGPTPVAGGRPLSIAVDDVAEHVTGELVGASYFAVLGLRPSLGRFFNPEEADLRQVAGAVISHELWHRQFGGTPDVVGRAFTINERSAEVIGVAPEGFGGLGGSAMIWLPIGAAAHLYQPGYLDVREFRWLSAIARLEPGMTPEIARDRLQAGLDALERTYPKEYEGLQFTVQSLRDAHFGDLEQPTWILLAAALLLIAMAATNLASLLLVRGLSRQRDVAVRVALGARLGGIAAGVAAEIALIVVIGTAAGLWLANASLPRIIAWSGITLPPFVQPDVDLLVVGMTLAICTFACAAAAFLPVRHALAVDPARLIRSGSGPSRSRRRMQSVLVAAETALAIVLLLGTGLLARGMQALVESDLGFSTDDITVMTVNVGSQRYAESERAANFAAEMLDRVRAIPGVTSAAIEGPGYPTSGTFGFHIFNDNAPGGPVDVMTNRHHVTPGYFATLRIPLVAGRDFTSGDRGGAGNVAIVSRELANDLWPNQSAVGRSFRTSRGTPITLTVIGVAETARHQGVSAETFVAPNLYLPMLHLPPRTPPVMSVLVHAPGMRATVPALLRAALRDVDPLLPPVAIRPLSGAVREQTANSRLLVTLTALFGTMALLLAAVGVYGIVAYAVQQSTREIGIRIALGASSRRIIVHVLRHGLVPVAIGIGIGAVATPAVQRLVESQLHGVEPSDPVALLGALAVLSLSAVVATLLPALRATRINAIASMRQE